MSNVERVKQILKEQGIEDDYNEYQLEYIARGYTFTVFSDSGLD